MSSSLTRFFKIRSRTCSFAVSTAKNNVLQPDSLNAETSSSSTEFANAADEREVDLLSVTGKKINRPPLIDPERIVEEIDRLQPPRLAPRP